MIFSKILELDIINDSSDIENNSWSDEYMNIYQTSLYNNTPIQKIFQKIEARMTFLRLTLSRCFMKKSVFVCTFRADRGKYDQNAHIKSIKMEIELL